MFVAHENNIIKEVIVSFMRKGRLLISNYYGLDSSFLYEYVEYAQTLLLRKKDRGFYRLYFLSFDNEDLISAIKSEVSNDVRYVINVPTKGDIDEWLIRMNRVHFHSIGTYKRLYNTKIKTRKSALGENALETDATMILELLERHFTSDVDYIPDRLELLNMIRGNRVLVDRNSNGNVCGVLIYTMNGRKCYLNAWVDEGENGLFLLYKVYNIMIEQGLSYAYFWVNENNINVIRLHTLMGAQFDGLNDYSFSNI